MPKRSGRPSRSDAAIRAAQSKIADHALRLFRDEGYEAVSIRRLAKEAGCAPMTIYAHFDGKIDILRYLWADVFGTLFTEIETTLEPIQSAQKQLQIAAEMFVAYWLKHPEHFRLVFMSNAVNRSDVSNFVQDDHTLAHFRFFYDLVRAVLPDGVAAKPKTDTLIAGLIGIALCATTIRDYPWTDARDMTRLLLDRLAY
jgi:AcrR family transcriptional regulator